MTPAVAIAKLAALGLSSDQLEGAAAILDAVLKDGLAEADRRIEEYRARERERKKRWRDAHPKDGKRRTETDGDGTERTETDETVSPSPFSPIPPLPTTPSKPSSARGNRIPEDFWPDAAIRDKALSLGLTPAEYTDQIERMKDHFESKSGKDATKTDWNKTARNWIRRAADDKTRRQGYGSRPTPKHSFADGFAKVDAAIAEAKRREHGEGVGNGQEDTGELPGLRKSAA